MWAAATGEDRVDYKLVLSCMTVIGHPHRKSGRMSYRDVAFREDAPGVGDTLDQVTANAQAMVAASAVTSALIGRVAIITTPMHVAHRRSVHAEDGTGPTLANAEQLPSMLDSLPLSGRPHQFFAATSFSTALSSIASASSRFSRPFSSSSTFSLRA